MKYQSIQEAMNQGSGEVAVRGWVHRERGSNKIKFVVLRDSTNVIQCVIKQEDFSEEEWKAIDKLQIEASMKLTGIIKPDERAPSGYEIQTKSFTITGESNNFPITKDLNEELLGDRRHLWLRSRKMTAIMKIRDTVLTAMREHWRNKGFYEYHSPSIIGMQCEGGSTMFDVQYFDKKAHLAQTWQLHAEPAIFALEKIFTIQPSFRAEKSNTSRHLTEYWHAEMELAWAEFEDLQDDAEELIKKIIKKVLTERKEELQILERKEEQLLPTIEKPFPRMTYDEALTILKEQCDMKVTWGKDLRTIEEDKLSRLYDTPIIITRYPKAVKAFYMKEDPKNKDVVLGFDMIGPEGYGELVGASQREESIKKLSENLKAQKEEPKDYEFYFDTRRYGSIPHGGYGMGLERVLAWICGLENIKDAIAFPRTPSRLAP
jgi:asparaginyl-tRNA synthetase